MKNSDKIAQILVENEIKDIFMVTGGAAMHLNDSLSRHNDIKTTIFHHEQSCSMAAEGYSKSSGKISAICVTAGPGGINALNGVFGAYGDSVPMLILSGQVRTETLNTDKNLRQLGDQEAPTTDIVNKITKYSKTLGKNDDVGAELTKAINIMNSGRKGPVWIDVPIDVQGSIYSKKTPLIKEGTTPLPNIEKKIDKLIEKINKSKRPLVIAGGGVWSSNSVFEFRNFINKTNLPVVSAFNGHDLLWENHKNFVGKSGTIGDRRGNIAVEASDLILVIGSSLNIRQIGYNFNEFGKDKFFCYVDIDYSELNKKTLSKNLDLTIQTDLKLFFEKFKYKDIKNSNHEEFKKWLRMVKKNYAVEKEVYKKTKKLNPYNFVLELSKFTKQNDIFVTANATAAIVPNQALKIKKNQRFIGNSTSGSMGYGLPAAIGACIAKPNNRVFCFEGDGSLQMNIQEIATVAKNNLKMLLFVISNDGYHSIRQTQNNYFKDNLIGIDSNTGLSFPNLKQIADAYGIKYKKVNINNYKVFLSELKSINFPMLVEVIVDKNIDFQPRVKSRTDKNGQIISSNLYDMHPFLKKSELEEVFTIKNI